MEKQSPRFYDIRFGILIVIIITILLFKYFGAQPSRSIPAAQPSSVQQQQRADSMSVNAGTRTTNASAH